MDEATLKIVVTDEGADDISAPPEVVPPPPPSSPANPRPATPTSSPPSERVPPPVVASTPAMPVKPILDKATVQQNERPITPQQPREPERRASSQPVLDSQPERRESQRQPERNGQQSEDRPRQSTPRKEPATFDPVAEAHKMREAEVRKEQIKAIYEDLYGTTEKTKSAFDATLDIAQKMRGTLGGTFGTLVGAVLDVMAAFREMEPKPKSSARVEAERRNEVEQKPQVPEPPEVIFGEVEPPIVNQPASTVQPEPTQHPQQTVQPTETVQPAATVQPSGTIQPEPTNQPLATVQPASTVQPDATKQPSETVQPSATIQPDATVQPGSVNQPENTIQPDATVQPEPTNQPQLSVVEAEQKPIPMPAVQQVTPPRRVDPAEQSPVVVNDSKEALQSLGHTQKEAEKLLKSVLDSATKVFGTVQEVLQAAYQKTPAQPVGRPNIEAPVERESIVPPVSPVLEHRNEMPAKSEAVTVNQRLEPIPSVTVSPEVSVSPVIQAAEPASNPPQATKASVEKPITPAKQHEPWSLESTQEKVLTSINRMQPTQRPADRERTQDTRRQEPMRPIQDEPERNSDERPQSFIEQIGDFANRMFGSKPRPDKPLPSVTPAPAGDTSKSVATVSKAVPPPTSGSMGAGGGMASGLAAAAPEIALVVAAAEATKAVLKSVRDGAVDAVHGLGDFATAIAIPDATPSKAVAGMGESAKKFGDQVLYVAPALGILASTAGEAATSLAKFMDVLDQRVNKYAEMNPQIAQAQAINEIKQTMGDLRRAQESGPQLARYLQLQGEMQQKFEDIKIKILLKILPIVNAIGTIMEKLVPSGEGIEQAITALHAPFAALVAVANMIANIQEDANRPEIHDPTDLIINLQTGQPGPGLAVPPAE